MGCVKKRQDCAAVRASIFGVFLGVGTSLCPKGPRNSCQMCSGCLCQALAPVGERW